MSKSAGTLITTYNAAYIPPRFMPNYQGHVPTMRFDYGETYGNATAKYFQDFRSETLNRSKTNFHSGGYFPSYYSFNPDRAVEARTRTWDRWGQMPPYRLTTMDHDRREELIKFQKQSLAHRENYCDKTGTTHKVEHFQIPTPVTAQFTKNMP